MHYNEKKAQTLFIEWISEWWNIQTHLEATLPNSRDVSFDRLKQKEGKWRSFLLDYQILPIYSSYDLWDYLEKPVSAFGMECLHDLINGEDYPVYVPEWESLHPAWEEVAQTHQFRHQHEQTYSAILACIRMSDQPDEYITRLMQFRDTLSRKEWNLVMKTREYEKLLRPFKENDKLHTLLASYFERIPPHTLEVHLCPHCGQPHKTALERGRNGRKNCLHPRCDIQMDVFEKQTGKRTITQPLSERRVYYRLTDWAVQFIRIPGLEERRIGEMTERAIDRHGDAEQMIYNPDGDRVDLLVCTREGKPLIQGDVKDYQRPADLIEALCQYPMEKQGELETVHIIIPQDVAHYTPGYCEIVQNHLPSEKQTFLQIVTESKWERLVVRSLSHHATERTVCP